MPCVCLKNTFRHWQALAALQPARVKSHRRIRIKTGILHKRSTSHEKIKQAKSPADKGTLSDSQVLRIPHAPRTRITSKPVEAPTTIALPTPKNKPTRYDLINAESRLGSAIFGPIPEGHRREFFHDRQNIWIWHEDWRDGDNFRQMTVRYEVRTSGIYKKVSTGKYFKLEGEELINFRKATRAYLYMIKKYIYNRPQTAQS